MDLINGELRSHLDPTAVQVLKKRLVAGKITPQVFKDILKQQMVKYFFKTYRHPLMKSLENWYAKIVLQSKKDQFQIYNHKRF